MLHNKRDEIALGLGGYLYPFAQARNASHYAQWNRDGLASSPTQSQRTFEQAFWEAARNARWIHFNLQGIRGDLSAWADRGRDYGFVGGNLTNAELHAIRSSPELLQKTTFYRQDKPVKSPF